MDDDSFLMWQQVLATPKGFQLMKFLEGCDIPPQFRTLEDVLNNKVNQEFLNYEMQDHTISHHITHDPHNFTSKRTYSSNEIVKLGNGTGMSILHVGSTSFSFPSNKTFLLR